MGDDESAEWVTVKIHEGVRDRARDDPRTYTEIMQAGLNKTPTDAPDVDVDAIVDELKTEVSNASAAVEPDANLDRIYEQLQRIEAAASTVEERTGKIERQLEDMGGR